MNEPEVEAQINSLWANVTQSQNRIHRVEELLDVWNSPWWKLIVFVADGWPLRRVAQQPQWRPWRRWWTS